jgi:hypothetical protein
MSIIVVGIKDEGVHEFDDAEAMKAAAASHGWTYTKDEDAGHLVPYLLGYPKFEELCGPMGGDPGKIRYETWAAYDLYSR